MRSRPTPVSGTRTGSMSTSSGTAARSGRATASADPSPDCGASGSGLERGEDATLLLRPLAERPGIDPELLEARDHHRVERLQIDPAAVALGHDARAQERTVVGLGRAGLEEIVASGGGRHRGEERGEEGEVEPVPSPG